MNPLFNSFNHGNNQFANISNMIQQFNQFKKTFTGNPKQEVMNLISSGQMSNEQFQQLQSMANQLRSILK